MCITNRRCPAVPSATKACSAAGECTSSTSASPRRPSSMAWPLPTASVLTCHPLSRVNAGSSSSSSPESWVLVVVARISDFSAEGPAAGGAGAAGTAAPHEQQHRRQDQGGDRVAHQVSLSATVQSRTTLECRGMTRYREIGEELARRVLAGDLVPGDELPGIRELGRQWSTTPSTASRAQRALAEAGLIELAGTAARPRRRRRACSLRVASCTATSSCGWRGATTPLSTWWSADSAGTWCRCRPTAAPPACARSPRVAPTPPRPTSCTTAAGTTHPSPAPCCVAAVRIWCTCGGASRGC